MQYVIIGSSAAGISAIEAIRTKDKTSKIAVISDEKNPLYSRCLISYLLAGTIDEKKIWYRKDSFFKNNKVEALLGVKAEEIDIKKKEVTFCRGQACLSPTLVLKNEWKNPIALLPPPTHATI